MPYDSMSAWDRQAFQFNDNIQHRYAPPYDAVNDRFELALLTASSGPAWSGVIPFDSTKGRTISRDDYTPPSPAASSEGAPSFTQAKASWSPPPSPRTRSLRYDSPPRRQDSSRQSSPRVDSPTSLESPSSPLTPKTAKEISSLASKLYAAACAGDTKHIRLLLSLGAEVNVPTLVDGLYDAFKPAKPGTLSALAGAAGNGQFGVVRVLLGNGAAINPTMKESSSSPLHQACKADDPAMAAYLLDNGADVNILNCFNTTPLMYAAQHGSPTLLRELLPYGPDLHRLSFINTAPLHLALWCGKVNNMELLLQAGANPNQKLGDGSTPLHCAAQLGLAGVVRLLVEYGADFSKRDEEWKTPLQVATEKQHAQVVEVLEQAERELQ